MNLLIMILSLLLSGIFCLEGMIYTPFNDDDDDAYRPELPNPWEWTLSYAPTPGYPDREWTPSVICPSPDTEDKLGERSPSLPSDKRNFDPVVECADGSAWDEQSPDRIYYQIE